MEQLFINFKNKVKEEGLVESICLSNKEGLLWKEQYVVLANRNIYSHSKSFTSLMVGIAIDEKKLDFDTKLVDVFKDEIDDETYSRLNKITVNNLLNMSSGFDEDYLFGWQKVLGMGYPDYLKFMLSRELKQEPGTKFHYSNGDTYLLSRMVEKVYNKKFTQLCYEKIFLPLEIGFPIWGCDPQGYCSAASELVLNVEQMNRLGIVFLNNGVYKGKRIVSEDYVKLCSQAQIQTPKDKYWGDYSCQFWMVPECDGYRADGAYGQFTIIMPKHGYTLSFQRSEDEKLSRVTELLKEEIFSKM